MRDATKKPAEEMRSGIFGLETLWQDVRFGSRLLRKSWGFTAVAVLTIALGIGVNSMVFSWINSTLLDPIPGMLHASGVVSLARGTAGEIGPFSYPDINDLLRHNHSFSGICAFRLAPMNLTDNTKPQRIWGEMVTANYFDVLGVKPILGRGFVPEEEKSSNGAPVVVISYGLWQSRFGRNPNIVGQNIHIDTYPFTVIGVAPRIFQGNYTGLRSELWVPVMMAPELGRGKGDKLLTQRDFNWLNALGRLRPGVSGEQAQVELTTLFQGIARQYPDSHKSPLTVVLFPLWRSPNGANYLLSKLLLILMCLAGVVLLLACVNIANLLLARNVSRQKEIALRLSLGARRWRLVRQLLTESLILSLAGGALALVVTPWSAGSLAKLVPSTNLPVSLSITMDRHVVLATLALLVVTSVLFGILPALRASGVNPGNVLKTESGTVAGGRSKTRLSSGMAIAQIALSLVLLVSAGLFIRSFRAARKYNPGFDAHGILLESYDLLPNAYTEAAGVAFDRQVLANVEALAGVRSASIADWAPLGFGSDKVESFIPEGYDVPGPNEVISAEVAHVSPGYFSTMRIPLLRGRDFSPEDTADSGAVVIINQALADRYWPRQDADGKQMKVDGQSVTVIGVARTANYDGPIAQPQPFFYLPMYQFYSSTAILHVRTIGDPLAMTADVERAVHLLNAGLPVFDVSTLDARIQSGSFLQRLAGMFVGVFGALALVLAAVGIYGVIAYNAKQRTHEIGIRRALGAQPRDVFGLVLGQGLRLTMIGLAIGLLVSFALTRFLSSLLFDVTATDPLTFVGVAFLLTIVSLAACYIPARRALRVDPAVALRYE